MQNFTLNHILYILFLGLYPLQRISSQARYELRVDMEDWDGETAFATYNAFEIGSAVENFKLTVGIYSGNSSLYIFHLLDIHAKSYKIR